MTTKLTKKKMEHGLTRVGSADTQRLVALLDVFRPTRALLAAATRQYLKDYPLPKRRVRHSIS